MESVLHAIEELQHLADDLATSTASLTRDRYELECDQFIERIETFIEDSNHENSDYLGTKLLEVRSNFRYLLREPKDETLQLLDLGKYQSLVNNGLNSIYRSIRNPVTTDADESDYSDYTH